MASKVFPTPRPHFTTIPLDVLSRIALDTVCLSSDPPTLRDLATVHSLVLTSRVMNQSLSFKCNPHLYASIMQQMCDVDAIQRRLGSRAVVASALASELPQRFTTLKRVRRRLHAFDNDATDTDANLVDLARLLLMLSEDNGKNRHQLSDILGPPGLARLCASLLLRNRQLCDAGFPTPDIAFVVALMWLNSGDAIIHEESERRGDILDFLQPYVLGQKTGGSSTPAFEYFGLRCALEIPSATPFARLCTVERYISTRSMQNITPNTSSTRPPWDWSNRFDDEYARYLRIHSLPSDGNRSPPLPQSHNDRLFESNWEGEWCLPCPISDTEIVMVSRPVQCQLREYICTDAECFVYWGGSNDDDDELSRAWFPEGVEFEETANSLRIFDPTASRWVSYEPISELVAPSDVVDTILFGETETDHAAEYGKYNFHGRVRHSDGKIALVRCPATPGMADFGVGIWVFHGDIYGRFDLVGEWTNTSSAKDAPAGHGWFHLAKDATNCLV